MKNISTSILLFIFYLLLTVSFAYADVTCQPIYGGGQSCVSTGQILIDKKVFNPSTLKMTDNLEINDPKFVPGSTINFQINVTNTGQSEIKSAEIKDIFSPYVVFTKGPGKFDANTKTLTFEVINLLPNESRIFTVSGKIVEANRIPMDNGIVCDVSQAIVLTIDAGTSQDNTQFCIQKSSSAGQKQSLVLPASTGKGGFSVLPAPNITTSPATGPSWQMLFSLIPIAIAGFFIRKKAIRNK